MFATQLLFHFDKKQSDLQSIWIMCVNIFHFYFSVVSYLNLTAELSQ